MTALRLVALAGASFASCTTVASKPAEVAVDIYAKSGPTLWDDLRLVDPSDEIDAREANVIAAAYAREHLEDDGVEHECPGLAAARRESSVWIIAVLRCLPTGQHVVVDARSGSVWGLGPRYDDLASLRAAARARLPEGYEVGPE